MPLLKNNQYTSEDYWNLPEGTRAELIDGKLYDMAPPSRFHQQLVMELAGTIRECLAAIYRALRTVNGKETDQVRFVSQFGKDMTLGLFKTALLVFEERGLVHSEIADDTFTATLIETSGKTDITRSPVLLALQ